VCRPRPPKQPGHSRHPVVPLGAPIWWYTASSRCGWRRMTIGSANSSTGRSGAVSASSRCPSLAQPGSGHLGHVDGVARLRRVLVGDHEHEALHLRAGATTRRAPDAAWGSRDDGPAVRPLRRRRGRRGIARTARAQALMLGWVSRRGGVLDVGNPSRSAVAASEIHCMSRPPRGTISSTVGVDVVDH
jgi:hypothetical protein